MQPLPKNGNNEICTLEKFVDKVYKEMIDC